MANPFDFIFEFVITSGYFVRWAAGADRQLSQSLVLLAKLILRPDGQNAIPSKPDCQDRIMPLVTFSPSRRSVLKFAGAMPAALALGGMGACTPRANHNPDQPHIADAEGEALWQAMEQAAATHTLQRQFPAALEAASNQKITLIGFMRKTPSLNRVLLSRRAIGCPACDAQKLWPVTEIQLADAPHQMPRGPVKISGEFNVRRFKDQLPFAIKRAQILEA